MMPSFTLKLKYKDLYFCLKVTCSERLYGVTIIKIRAIKNLSLGGPLITFPAILVKDKLLWGKV
jgi:hypothetical protein